MKIEITTTERVVKEIEVDLPYYYKYDLSEDNYDSVIYGVITEKDQKTISRTERFYSKEIEWEMAIHPHHSIKESGLASYFKKEHASSKEEYEQARTEMMEFLKNF